MEEKAISTERPTGTPNYMSPEHWSGPRRMDARSDLYSLGVVLYELLAGSLPFKAPDLRTLRSVQSSTVPADIPGVGAATMSLIHRCLQHDRENRWRSCAAILEVLGESESAAAQGSA